MEVYIGVGIVVLFMVASIVAVIHATWRARKLTEIAASLNFKYVKKNDALLKSLQGLSLFQEKNCQGWDFMRGEADGITITMFENSHSRRSSSKHPLKQTVLVFQSERLKLPNFSLRLSDWSSGIAAAVTGYQDIDFPDYPTFSKMFHLTGNDEGAIRRCFDQRKLEYLQRNASWSVDGHRNHLMVCRLRKSVKVKNINGFLKEGYELFQLFQVGSDTT